MEFVPRIWARPSQSPHDADQGRPVSCVALARAPVLALLGVGVAAARARLGWRELRCGRAGVGICVGGALRAGTRVALRACSDALVLRTCLGFV